MTLLFMALIISYFTDKKVWMRWALLIATVPIAILANGMRVAITASPFRNQYRMASAAGYHEVEGFIIYFIDIIALLAVHRLINVVVKKMGKA